MTAPGCCRPARFRRGAAGHPSGVTDDDNGVPPSEGDREWREVTQETGEQAERLQPPVPANPESAPTPNPREG
jgi:hypothetical protein